MFKLSHCLEMTLTCSAIDSLQPIADTRPAFRRDALCMLGACLRHPVTRAIRDDALRLDPPDWTAGHEALGRLASLLSGALIRVITDRSLPFEPAPSWDRARPALDRVFGINLAHHFLHAAPLEWLQAARLTNHRSPRASPTFSTPTAARPGQSGSERCCGPSAPSPEKPTAASAR